MPWALKLIILKETHMRFKNKINLELELYKRDEKIKQLEAEINSTKWEVADLLHKFKKLSKKCDIIKEERCSVPSSAPTVSEDELRQQAMKLKRSNILEDINSNGDIDGDEFDEAILAGSI